MKNLLACFSALLLITSVQAQEDDRRGFLSLSLGVAAPFGDFSNTSSDNDDAGFAMTGGNVNIAFGYKLGQTLGLTAMLNAGSNPLDNEALENEFQDNFPQSSWDIDSDPWSYGTLMVGGFATFPAGTRSSFDIRMLIGALSSTAPEIRATATSFGVSGTATRQSKTVMTGAFDVGFIYRYRITDPLCVFASADFLTANPKFENVETTGTFGTSTSDFDQNLRVLNLNVGVAFLLK
jgi:hypothetical protein